MWHSMARMYWKENVCRKCIDKYLPYIKEFEKLLSGGIWCILTLSYEFDELSIGDSPFKLGKLKPIQIANLNMPDVYEGRKKFTKDQWIIFLLRSAGMEPEVFDKDEVDRIYLNFSDPWPKDRHAKRRLTSTRFLERYDNILTPEGRVMFKTDNKDLFDFSLEQVEEAGWILENHTYDLHHSEYNEGNVMTEYEEKFSAKGNPICRLVAYRHAK